MNYYFVVRDNYKLQSTNEPLHLLYFKYVQREYTKINENMDLVNKRKIIGCFYDCKTIKIYNIFHKISF